jgi:hypothetical protein
MPDEDDDMKDGAAMPSDDAEGTGNKDGEDDGM